MNKYLIINTGIAVASYFSSFLVFLVFYPARPQDRLILFQETGPYFKILVENWVWILIASTVLAWVLSLFIKKFVSFLPLIGPILLIYIVVVFVTTDPTKNTIKNFTGDSPDQQKIESTREGDATNRDRAENPEKPDGDQQ